MAEKNVQIVLLAMPRRYWLARRAAIGVAAYARQHAPWELIIPPLDQPELVQTPAEMGAIGAIVSTGVPRPERLARCPQPVVVLDSDLLAGVRPSVRTDHHAVGTLAADYFLSRGFHHFGYIGGGRNPDDGWFQGLNDRLAGERACTLASLPGSLGIGRRPYRQILQDLGDWIARLPRPCAILACDDQHGAVAIQSARVAGLRVPEDVAVLGVQDEAIFREAAHVPLSSIALACERMGYEAARMLHAMLEGGEVPLEPLLIPPVEVVTRRSTECHVVGDEEVRRAMDWIAEHLSERFGIDDLVADLSLSRSSLERRFKAHLGRTPQEEVLRQRIERARVLLVDTDWDLKRVAKSCGFAGREYFGNVFRRETGQSPAAYRNRFLRRGLESAGAGWSASPTA